MSLIGRKSLSAEAAAERAQSTNSFELVNNFVDGLKFSVTNANVNYLTDVWTDNDGNQEEGKPYPALSTNVGLLPLRWLNQIKLDVDGTPHRSSGDAVDLIRITAAEHATDVDAEKFKALFEKLKDKTILVRREVFSAVSKTGDHYPGYVLNLTFVS